MKSWLFDLEIKILIFIASEIIIIPGNNSIYTFQPSTKEGKFLENQYLALYLSLYLSVSLCFYPHLFSF